MTSRGRRPLSPHLQVYRWQISMTLSILHRGTGLLLCAAVLLLAYWLLALAAGPQAYAHAQAIFAHPLLRAVWIAISFAFFYHLCNGIRHLFWDIGWGFSLPQMRASGWTVVAVSSVLTAAFWLIPMLG